MNAEIIVENKQNTASVFIIIGLAVVFLYAALDSFVNPTNWIGFFPVWMRNIIQGEILLPAFGIFEILLSLWLISRKYLFYSAIVAAATAFGIVIFNLGVFDVVFRDIAIGFAALALAVLNYHD